MHNKIKIITLSQRVTYHINKLILQTEFPNLQNSHNIAF